ncbi:MAG: cation diffusion facilitator family transporter [Candidatus Bathyarchaeia archaeon]
MRSKQAACIALMGGLAVFGLKMVAYLISNSVAMLSDAFESIVNIAASGMMLYAVHISNRPPDETHNYGHQKAEEVSRLLEGGLILTATVMIIHTSLERLFSPTELLELNLAIGVSMSATAGNGALSLFLSRAAKANSSAALEGDAKHLLSDVASSGAVWIGLILAKQTGWNAIDPILALLVATLIAKMGIELILKSSRNLMDGSCKEEEKIKEILLRHRAHFTDFHNLRTRRQGNKIYSELHLSVPGNITVEEAHSLADHLEDELKHEIPDIDLTIHVEPQKRINTDS